VGALGAVLAVAEESGYRLLLDEQSLRNLELTNYVKPSLIVVDYIR